MESNYCKELKLESHIAKVNKDTVMEIVASWQLAKQMQAAFARMDELQKQVTDLQREIGGVQLLNERVDKMAKFCAALKKEQA